MGYEILSGAGIAFAALLLIIPGFLTDLIGFLLIFPFTRKFLFKKISKKFNNNNARQKNNFIMEFYITKRINLLLSVVR